MSGSACPATLRHLYRSTSLASANFSSTLRTPGLTPWRKLQTYGSHWPIATAKRVLNGGTGFNLFPTFKSAFSAS